MAENAIVNRTGTRRCKAKALLTIARSNLESWFYSPRTIVAFVFIVLICFMEVSALNRQLQSANLVFHYPEMLFYVFYTGCNNKMISTMLLIAVCEMPRRIVFQNYALIRSTRKEFLMAQMIYCLAIVLIALLLVAICASVFTIGHLSAGSNWSDNARVAAGVMREDQTVISEFFRKSMNPGVAIFFAVMPMFFFWFTMLMVVLLFSIFSKPLLGIIIYVFILWSSSILMFEGIPGIVLPSQFAPLRSMALEYRDEAMGYYGRVMMGYVIVDAALIIAMFIRIKHCDLAFNATAKV